MDVRPQNAGKHTYVEMPSTVKMGYALLMGSSIFVLGGGASLTLESLDLRHHVDLRGTRHHVDLRVLNFAAFASQQTRT